MANSIVRATACEIDVAGISVTGLMLPDGEYRMSDADIARAVGENPKNALNHFRRDVNGFIAPQNRSLTGSKPLSQEEFIAPQKVKFAVPGIAKTTTANASPVMLAAMYWASLSRVNSSALALTVALATETIERRFDRAFNQKVSEAEYDARLALRLQRLEARRSWTDVIKERLEQQGLYDNRVYASSVFKDLTVQVNLALFGQPHFRCDRDNMTIKEQNLIGSFETLCARKADQFPSDTAEELVEKVLLCF